MATVRIYQGERLLIETRLPAGRMVVGRADGCDIALPDDQVSRTHCFLERSHDGSLRVIDRSRHGTFLNGDRVDRADLADGDRVAVGSFILELSLESGAPDATATTRRPAGHEQILGADGASMGVVRLLLRLTTGPAAGSEHRITSVETTVGAYPSDVVVGDPSLVAAHFRMVVNRDRPMVEPRGGSITVDGARIRGLFPLGLGEPFTAGETTFRVAAAQSEETPVSDSFGEMVGVSRPMRRVFGLLQRMAPHQETVLLLGESGTGKELAARGLHDAGARPEGPFVALNCAALTESLLEAELFGHEKGAFTGATGRRDGAFQAAHGGTLFLDEVGEIPLSDQAKLLRALESGEIRRVGSQVPEFPDVRVVAATNRDLLREVAAGRFREDLYFRLAVLSVRIPPLRERMEDLEALARRFSAAMRPPVHVTEGAMAALRRHLWPGNVRELRNVLIRAHVLHGSPLTKETLSFDMVQEGDGWPMTAEDRPDSVSALERELVREAMEQTKGNRARAAKKLGIPRTTLIYKLRRLDLD